MSRTIFARLLKDKVIKRLQLLIDTLEDESRLCFPERFDCSSHLKEVIVELKRLRKKSKELS